MKSQAFSKFVLIFYWLLSISSIFGSLYNLPPSPSMIVILSVAGLAIGTMALWIEVLRNRKEPNKNEHVFFMSNLPKNMLLFLMALGIIQTDVNKFILLLLIGAYALFQAVVISIMLYVLKIKIVWGKDKVGRHEG
jgi:hypothetical protein